jgi:DNA-directed RNA polymerase subunit RPC12/RpoP
MCTCAVCGTAYPRPVEHAIRRCPKCGSRLIRAEEGSALGIAALSTALPPKPKPEHAVKKRGAPAPPIDRRPGALIVGGVVLAAMGLVLGLRTWNVGYFLLATTAGDWVYAVLAVSLVASGVWCFIRGIVVTSRTGVGTGVGLLPRHTRCVFCAYPIPFGHVGRCPECGRLQNPMLPTNYRCPHCRRDLHDFHGDHCPECGGDVRTVTDGPAPEEQV